MALEIHPVFVGLLVDRDRSLLCDIDAVDGKFVTCKPKRNSDDVSKHKKIHFDHVQVMEAPIDLLIQRCQLTSQLASLFAGFNAAVITLDTRDPSAKTNGLLLMILRKLQGIFAQLPHDSDVRVSYMLLAVTDTRCMDVTRPTASPTIPLAHLANPAQFDKLFVDAGSTIESILESLTDRPFDLPTVLQIKLEGTIAGQEFSSRFLCADLAWSKPPLGTPAAAIQPALVNSLKELDDLSRTLVTRPTGAVIEPDKMGGGLVALLLPFLAFSSRTLWLHKLTLDDSDTPHWLTFLDRIRRVRVLLTRNHQAVSSAALVDLQDRLQDMRVQHDQLVYSHTLVHRQLRESQTENAQLADQVASLQARDRARDDELREVKEELARERKLRDAIQSTVIDAQLAEKTFELDRIDHRMALNGLRAQVLYAEVDADKANLMATFMQADVDKARFSAAREAEDAQAARVQRDELVAQLKGALKQVRSTENRYRVLADRFNHLAKKYDAVQPAARQASALDVERRQAEQAIDEVQGEFAQRVDEWNKERERLEREAQEATAEAQRTADDVISFMDDYELLRLENHDLRVEQQRILDEARTAQQSMQSRIDDMQRAVADMEREAATHRGAKSSKELEQAKHITDLRKERIELQRKIDELEVAMEGLEADKADLRAAVDRARDEALRVRAEVGKRRRDTLVGGRISGMATDDDGTGVGAGADAAAADAADNAEYGARHAQWLQRETELMDALAESRTKARQLAYEASNLQAEVERLHKQAARTDDVIKGMAESASKLQRELSEAYERIASMQSALTLARAEADKATGECQVARATLRTREHELGAQLAAREQEYKEAVRVAERQAAEAAQERERVAQALQEAEGKLADVEAKLEWTERDFNQAIARLQAERADAKRRESKLGDQIRQLRLSATGGGGSVNGSADVDNERIAQLEAEVDELTKELREARAAADKAERAARKERTTYEKAVADAKKEAARLADRVHELEAEAQAIQAAASKGVTGTKANVDRLARDKAKLEAELARLQEQAANEVADLQGKVKEMEKIKREADLRVRKLETQVETLRTATPEQPLITPAELGKLQRENKRMAKRVAELEDQVKTLNDEVNRNDTAASQAGKISSAALDRLRKDHDRAKQELERVRGEQEQLAQELDKAKERAARADRMQAELDVVTAEKNQLAGELLDAFKKTTALGKERDLLKGQLSSSSAASSRPAPRPSTAPSHVSSAEMSSPPPPTVAPDAVGAQKKAGKAAAGKAKAGAKPNNKSAAASREDSGTGSDSAVVAPAAPLPRAKRGGGAAPPAPAPAPASTSPSGRPERRARAAAGKVNFNEDKDDDSDTESTDDADEQVQAAMPPPSRRPATTSRPRKAAASDAVAVLGRSAASRSADSSAIPSNEFDIVIETPSRPPQRSSPLASSREPAHSDVDDGDQAAQPGNTKTKRPQAPRRRAAAKAAIVEDADAMDVDGETEDAEPAPPAPATKPRAARAAKRKATDDSDAGGSATESSTAAATVATSSPRKTAAKRARNGTTAGSRKAPPAKENQHSADAVDPMLAALNGTSLSRAVAAATSSSAVPQLPSSDGPESLASGSSGGAGGDRRAMARRRIFQKAGAQPIALMPPGTPELPDSSAKMTKALGFFKDGFSVPDVRQQASAQAGETAASGANGRQR